MAEREYTQEVIDSAVSMLHEGITRPSVAAVLTANTGEVYTVSDVEKIIDAYRESQKGNIEGKQQNAFSKAVYLMNHRKQLTTLLLIVVLAFLALVGGLVALGIFVTWIPLIVFAVLFFFYIVFEVMWTVRMLKAGNGPSDSGPPTK